MVDLQLRLRNSLRTTSRQAMLFVAFGCIAAVVDYLSYRGFVALDIPTAIARGSSYILGSTTAFLLNRRWAFDGNGSRREAFRGAGVYLVVFVLIVASNQFALISLAGIGSAIFWAWFLSQALGTFVNFFLQKLYVFRLQSDRSVTVSETWRTGEGYVA